MSRAKTVLLSSIVIAWAFASTRAEEAPGAAALEAGRAALERQDYAVALKEAERALEQSPKLRAARLLRGTALLAAGENKRGHAQLRELLTELEAAVPLSEADKALWARGRDLLVESSKPDKELDALLQKQAEKLAKTGKKFLKKDPCAAERAALAALAFDPSHTGASELLTKSRAGLTGKAEKLIDSSMAQWTWRSPENWPFKGGVLVGFAAGTQVITRTNRRWSGDFDVIVEARMIEGFREKGPTYFGLLVPFVSVDRYLSFGHIVGRADFYEEKPGVSGSLRSARLTEIGGGIDPKSWIRFEMRMRKTEIIALVNGVEIGRCPRPADLKEGHVALSVQCCRAEFRRVDVIRK